jgi:hypothetical protein
MEKVNMVDVLYMYEDRTMKPFKTILSRDERDERE